MSKRAAILVKPRQGRRARQGCPWIFSNEIEAQSIAPGTVVDVKGDDGQALGSGFYNPKSLIAVRLFARDLGQTPTREFFERRLAHALVLRERLYRNPFYRLVHAEGDGLPGLVIDRFADVLVVQVTVAGMELALEALMAALRNLVAPTAILLRNDAPARALEGLPLYVRWDLGPAGRVAVEENDTRYFADLGEGQKTGWYYDQRDNRAFIANLAQGKSVLDAYSYTGGFAILAARKGAKEVICLDSSEAALALAQESAAANRVGVSAVRADVFEELDRLSGRKEQFDIVVADPPPFVKSRKDLEPGAKAYRKLARLAAQVTGAHGFLLLASCSHNIPLERFAAECAAGIRKAGRNARLVHVGGAGPDHPVHPMLPESAYLKALVYMLD